MHERNSHLAVAAVETGLLLLVAFLPFVFFATNWALDAPLAVLILSVTLFIAAVSAVGRVPSIGFGAAALAAWIGIQIVRAPVWDRSIELGAIWGTAFLLGATVRLIDSPQRSTAFRVCLVLWITATLISTFNPLWRTPIEELEAVIEEEAMEETYKEALLHAASQERFHFPFGNPIDLGTYLSFSLLAAPFLYSRARASQSPGILTLGLAASGLVQLYILWGTRSRTPLLGLLAGACVWVLASDRLRGRSVGLIGAGTGALVALLLFSSTAREMAGRVETIQARLVFWEIAGRMIVDAPLLGFGVGGYGDHYPAYRSLTTHQTLYPHNILLESMTDLGVVGTILLLWIVFRRLGLVTAGSGSPSSIWGAACSASFGVGALVGFPHNLLYLAGPWAVIVGSSLRGASPPRPARFAVRTAWITIIFLLSVPACMRELGHIRHERALESDRIHRDPSAAMSHLESAVRIWPPLAESWAYQASLYSSAGAAEEALRRVDQAVRWEPTAANIRALKAEILWRAGSRDQALATLEEGVRLHPVRWDYHRQKSRWLFEMGRTEEAAAARDRASALEPYEPRYDQARSGKGSGSQ